MQRVCFVAHLLHEHAEGDSTSPFRGCAKEEPLLKSFQVCGGVHEGSFLTTGIRREPEPRFCFERYLPRAHLDLVLIHGIDKEAEIFCRLISHGPRAGVALTRNGA